MHKIWFINLNGNEFKRMHFRKSNQWDDEPGAQDRVNKFKRKKHLQWEEEDKHVWILERWQWYPATFWRDK